MRRIVDLATGSIVRIIMKMLRLSFVATEVG